MTDILRRVKVEILGDAKGLKGAAGEAEGALDRMSGGFSKVAKATAVIGGGLTIAGAAAFSFAEAAAEDEKAATALAKTLQNAAGATDDQVAATEAWISAQGKALGVADDQLRPAMDRLVRATGDVGQAQKLAGLAMDISAGTGKDLVTVSEALAKAQNGNLGALKKLDPALADLIKNTGSSELALESLAQTFDGQASAAADTAAGKLAIAKLQFGEMQEEIGARLIPVLAALSTWFVESVIPAIERLVGWVETNWPRFRATVEQGLAAIQEAWATYGQPVLDAIIAAVNTFIGIAQGLWATFGGTIKQHISDTWDNVKTIFGGAFDFITGIWNTFKGLFTGDWGLMWDGIKSTVSGAWDLIKGIVGLALDNLKAAIGLAWDGIKAGVGTAWDGIKSAIGDKVNAVKDRVMEGVDGIVQFFVDLPGRITEQIGAIGGAALEVGKSIINKLGEGLSNMVGFTTDIAAAVAKAVKGAINTIIDKVNAAFEFTIPMKFIPDIHVNPPDIPKLHTGGIFNSGRGEGLALLQDGEGVFTRDQLQALPSLYGGRGGGVTNIHNHYWTVDATTDRVELGRALMEAIDAANRAGVRSDTLALAS